MPRTRSSARTICAAEKSTRAGHDDGRAIPVRRGEGTAAAPRAALDSAHERLEQLRDVAADASGETGRHAVGDHGAHRTRRSARPGRDSSAGAAVARLIAVRPISCAPSSIGLRIFSSALRAGIGRADHDRSDEVARQRPAVPVSVSDDAIGPRAQADRQAADDLAGTQGWPADRRVRHAAQASSIGGARRPESLEDGDQRIQRMRQDVDELFRKARGRPGVRIADPPAGTRNGCRPARASPSVRPPARSASRTPDRAAAGVPRTPASPAARARSSSARASCGPQRERLLDVDVRARPRAPRAPPAKCAAGGVQTCTTSGRALASSASIDADGTRAGGIAKLGARARGAVVDADRHRDGPQSRQRPEMLAGHLPGADERDIAQGSS